MRDFSVLGGDAIGRLLAGREQEIIERIRLGYLRHDAGDSVNPASQFLRFPDKPDARIIALPATSATPPR
jgi:ornithine cyclodeaminase